MPVPEAGTHGLARVLSKRGLASRSEAERLVRAGRVAVEGRIVTDPEARTRSDAAIALDGRPAQAERRVYLMLNKPRGLVTTRSDPEGRPTVYRCLEGMDLPHLAPVGRLDKASEGLLLFTNDTLWANAILDGPQAPAKTYHVQIGARVDDALLSQLLAGVSEGGEHLAVRSATLLREGAKNSWLEIVLAEGRNRHIRRLLAAHDVETLRLVRTAIGPLRLGDLGKGAARLLTLEEARTLAPV